MGTTSNTTSSLAALARVALLALAAVLAIAAALAMLPGCTTGTPITPMPDAGPRADGGPRIDARPMPEDAGPPPACTDEGRGATIGDACESHAACDDHCTCNGVERCVEGMCTAGPAACAASACATATCDEEEGCVYETDDALCDDGEPCNGEERCDARLGCRASAPPTCNDASSCTVDACEPGVGCVYETIDGDGDGAPARSCGGSDCNDASAAIGPDAAEVCDNAIDDDCDGTFDIDDGDCRAMNDGCAGATDVTPSGLGTFRHRGSTIGFVSDATLACTPSSTDTRRTAPDAVYTFTLDAMRDVTIGVEGLGYNAGILLRTRAACGTGPDLRCSATSSSTVEPVLHAHRLPAGDYAVIVKTRTAGSFTLVLTVADPSASQSEICAPDAVDVSAGGTFTGSFADDDYDLGCHATTSSAYPDAAHRLVVPAGELRDVHLTATARAPSGSSSTPYVELTSACGDTMATTAECDSGTSSVPAELTVRALPAGTYYVLVENASTTAGTATYTLTAELTPTTGLTPGDACDAGVPVALADGVPGSVDLATLDPARDALEFCGANRPGYRDAFFTFTLGAPRDVLVRTTGTARHWVGISTTCGTVALPSDCTVSSGGSSMRRLVRLPAGTYFLNVSTLGDTGTIDATITTSPPTPAPGNDVCSGGATLVDGTPTDVDLTLYSDDAAYACGASGSLDAYYTFTLAAQRFVTLRAEGATSMALLSGSCTATAAPCVTGSPPQILQTLDPGTYHVVVESPVLDAGMVRVRFTTADP